MIGYESPGLRILDETGLVSPEIALRRQQGPGWYTDLVAGRQPEWLVVRQGVLRNLNPFAGTGAPFRSQAELDSVRARYDEVFATSREPNNEDLVVLRRTR